MHTYLIHITGIVQGVGFRPFVYKIANGLGLKGNIQNGLDGVHFEFNAEEDLANNVYKSIVEQAPSNARIHGHSISQITHTNFSSLQIIRSTESGNPNMPLTPDFALCPTCRNELQNPINRRFNYPFITCTYCGPRYSITHKLPYDRHTTAMDKFAICPDCQKEYDNPLDRRYYSQTNSCDACSIKLTFIESNSTTKNDVIQSNEEIIKEVVAQLNRQKIIAIKGIGGYLLMCDAQNEQAIKTLRTRKHRPTKPFAVMYPSFEALNHEFKINAEEKDALTDEVSSIVLLQKRDNQILSLSVNLIAPGLNRIGCMVPYAPLYQLILNAYQKPVIATSANISGSPIIYDDESALKELAVIADGILMHNRPILIPQDDSVISFTALHNHQIIHRRSRGMAPGFETGIFKDVSKTIMATGGQMKSSFSLLTKNRVYISQYLGDMDNFLTQQAYQHTVKHMHSILSCEPEMVICDLHPTYFTTEWTKEKVEEMNINLYQVQHHKAHFAAVLAENNIINSQEPILGVIWDGTGLGDDDQIWGGEFFIHYEKKIDRIDHIGYFPFILGDKMAQEPRISAMCICNSISGDEEILKQKFTTQEWNLYQKMLSRDKTTLSTSSVGRLFDAVASLVLGMNKTSYEGEAAIQLENLAKSYKKTDHPSISYSYFNNQNEIPSNKGEYLFNAILDDLKKGSKPDKIAYSFHISLVDLVRMVATKNNIKKIAFSGGVFQNELLIDMIISLLQHEFKLFFHKQLSPNDENISFGQLAYYILSNEQINR
jgi:hydrogenase maturation protein HypF